MKTKIFLSFKKLQKLIQEKPEKSALVVAIIIVAPMLIWGLSIIHLPKEITFDSVSELIFVIILQILTFACVGGMFWWMFAMSFGEKKQKELSEQALKSEIELMINTELIRNGSITKAEEMVKL